MLAARRDSRAAVAAGADGTATVSAPRAAEPAPYLQRLPPVVSPHEQSTAVKTVAPADEMRSGIEDEAVLAEPPTLEDGAAPDFDEAAESAFRAEARERGEAVGVSTRPSGEPADETASKKALPPLEQLVNQVPAAVREQLEDLFRARFVAVKRFPKKAMKEQGGAVGPA